MWKKECKSTVSDRENSRLSALVRQGKASRWKPYRSIDDTFLKE